MPCIFANQHRRASPRCVECANLESAIDKALFIEQPVRRKKNFSMHVADDGLFSSQRYVERTIIDGVVPDFVKSESDIHRREGWNRGAVLLVYVFDERARANRNVADSAFEEIAAYGGLGEERDLRARVKRIELRENFAEVREIPRVVALSRFELYDCKVH